MGEANIRNVDVKMLGEQLLEFPPPFLGNWSSAIFFFPKNKDFKEVIESLKVMYFPGLFPHL